MTNSFYLVSDTNRNSKKIRSHVLKKIKITSLKKSKAIIVIGGDGFMLHSLKKFYKSKKSFYGINSGNYGFLMNKFSKKKRIRLYKQNKACSNSSISYVCRKKKRL